MEYNDILKLVSKINSGEQKTGYEFETEYCPKCGSNQYQSDTNYCLTCTINATTTIDDLRRKEEEPNISVIP